MNYPYTCDGMITIECQANVTSTLTKTQASELTALVAKDMKAVLDVTHQSALVFCGAAFSSEQLLQPGFPIQQHITQYSSAVFQGQLNTDQILSIGAKAGTMPDGLQPQSKAPSLLHFPFCLYTHDLELAERFEAKLMHKGMVSPPTYAKLTELLKTTINHANYMTYLDLVAMMHNHYEQMGMSHLWKIIETALLSKAPKKAIQTETHNHFFLIDHLLFTPYYSWQQFKQFFNINDAESYVNWVMAQRMSLGALTAHGLEIKAFNTVQWPMDSERICLGEFEKNRLKQSFWTDVFTPSKTTESCQVIHYTHPHAGIIAIGVEAAGKTAAIHYPISPHGLLEIERTLQQKLGPDWVTIERDFSSHADQLSQ